MPQNKKPGHTQRQLWIPDELYGEVDDMTVQENKDKGAVRRADKTSIHDMLVRLIQEGVEARREQVSS